MRPHVVLAIFLRNLKSYFSNPAGYVFICFFAFFCAVAAFAPHEFFNANLANFDQLSRWMPLILLVFIPAITMSVWADERRQGTDELLLTIPATDFDVVLGKYLAAAAIFSAALLFSTINFLWLMRWGNPDWGLIVATYFGYWLVGLAMLAIGMTASFLTGNLTVAFILGAVLNLPLVAIFWADAIPLIPPSVTLAVKDMSIPEQFRDFGQGVINFSSLLYFGLVIVVSLYLCLVLIGRRHWMGGRDGHSMLGHYIVRAVCLICAAVGLYVAVSHVPALNLARLDVTVERLTSLTPQTRQLLDELKPEQAVLIDAYISPEVPEAYVQQRLNLISRLREFESLGGGNIKVQILATEPRTDRAHYAEQQYGIVPEIVRDFSRGRLSEQEIYLGVAFTSGLNKVVVPFMDRGIPVEYELVRSIATVSQQERKKVGVLATDVQLYGGFSMTGGMTNNQLIITELEKQYDVVPVRADSPITEKFDVLLAVQPSSLNPMQMKNFIAAVLGGQATAIFEDPLPYIDKLNRGTLAGTTDEKTPPGGMQAMMMGQQPPMPKGSILPLFTKLGINFSGFREEHVDPAEAVWQDYMPYDGFKAYPLSEFLVIVNRGLGNETFNAEQPVSADLQEMMLPVPGYIEKLNASEELTFTPLVHTGDQTGAVEAAKLLSTPPQELPRLLKHSGQRYVVAAHIQGTLKPDLAMAEGDESTAAEAAEEDAAEPVAAGEAEIDVTLVADIDCLMSEFFVMRQQVDQDNRVPRFDNVTFVLNVLDQLAGDERFVAIRGKRPTHRTLTAIEARMEEAAVSAREARKKYESSFEEATKAAQTSFDDKLEAIKKRTDLDPVDMARRVMLAEEVEKRRLKAENDRLKEERDTKVRDAEREEETTIRQVRNFEKGLAIGLSWILPAIVGLGALIVIRVRETEGVSKSRLR